MSGQRHDACLFNHELYVVTWVENAPLFSPRDFGFRPSFNAWRTDCVCGFHCTYGIGSNGLFLLRFVIHAEDGQYPALEGVAARFDEDESAYVFAPLRKQLDYSGKLRIAKGLIHDLYVHGGYQEEIAFENVFEFEFRVGKVVSGRGISKQIARQREETVQRLREEQAQRRERMLKQTVEDQENLAE